MKILILFFKNLVVGRVPGRKCSSTAGHELYPVRLGFNQTSARGRYSGIYDFYKEWGNFISDLYKGDNFPKVVV